MVQLHITAIGQQGDGLSLYKDKKTFVDEGLPEEIVEAKLRPSSDGQSYRAQITDIVKASPIRETPPCPHYQQCGGCQLQHMTQSAYQQWKRDSVIQTLIKYNVTPARYEPPIFIGAHTRRRASFVAMRQGKTIQIGFHRKRSHQMTAIETCLVLDPKLMAAKTALEPYLEDIVPQRGSIDIFLQMVGEHIDCVLTGFIGKEKQPDLGVKQAVAEIIHNTSITRISWRVRERAEPELLIERSAVAIKMGELMVHLPPLAFLQPSIEGAHALISQVLAALPEQPALKVADLFAGNGTFTGTLLAAGHDVSAYESEAAAVQALHKSSHQKAFKRDLFKDPLSASESKAYDVVVLDPPRAGAKAQCIELAKAEVPFIIYVSCNPTSFAKDAVKLVEGGYHFERLAMVDQFIWSVHTEIIGVFTKSTE